MVARARLAGPSGIWGLISVIEEKVWGNDVWGGTVSAVVGESEQSFFRQMKGIHALLINLKEKIEYADQRSPRQPTQEILPCEMSL